MPLALCCLQEPALWSSRPWRTAGWKAPSSQACRAPTKPSGDRTKCMSKSLSPKLCFRGYNLTSGLSGSQGPYAHWVHPLYTCRHGTLPPSPPARPTGPNITPFSPGPSAFSSARLQGIDSRLQNPRAAHCFQVAENWNQRRNHCHVPQRPGVQSHGHACPRRTAGEGQRRAKADTGGRKPRRCPAWSLPFAERALSALIPDSPSKGCL